MDIEHLNKSQIILLTLLVSFVTSIATGIVTVTLLERAPTAVTQTINRVVERTVERVVPDLSRKPQDGGTIKEVTVVVKEDDLITDSVERNRGTLVRILAQPVGGQEAQSEVVGIGAVVDSSGIVATARSIFVDGYTYTAINQSGSIFSFRVLNLGSSAPIALLQLAVKNTSDGKSSSPAPLSTLKITDPLSLKLGQSVIALSGEERASVSIGIISMLEEKVVPTGDGAGAATTTVVAFIHSSIDSLSALAGSPLLNIFGEAIGIRTASVPSSGTTFIPSSVITSELSAIAAKPAAPKGQ